MDRFQIKEMRDQIESNGFYVEEIQDDCIVISYLRDKHCKQFIVSYEHKCPECGSFVFIDETSKDVMCLNKECFFEDQLLTPPEPLAEQEDQMIYKQIVLACNASDYMYLNTVLQEIQEIVDNWCEVVLLEDGIHPESTLGLE